LSSGDKWNADFQQILQVDPLGFYSKPSQTDVKAIVLSVGGFPLKQFCG
jgi:hypothetical protein